MGEPIRDERPPARMIAAWDTTPMLDPPGILAMPLEGLKLCPVARADRASRRIPSELTLGMTVGEVMITNPKTLSADARVEEVRRMFEHSSQRTVLLAEGGMFRGAIDRDGVPPTASGDEPAVRFAQTQPTATPATPMAEAVAMIEQRPQPRLVVLGEDGVSLCGLLCFNRSSRGFCVE